MVSNPRCGGFTRSLAAILSREAQLPTTPLGSHAAIIIILAVFGVAACMATSIAFIWRRNHRLASRTDVETRSVCSDKIASVTIDQISHLPPAYLESTHSVRSSFSSSKTYLGAPRPAFVHRTAPSDVPASLHSSYAWDSVYQEEKLPCSGSYPAEDLLDTLADRFYWEADGAIPRAHSRTSQSVFSSRRSSLGCPQDCKRLNFHGVCTLSC